MSSGLDFYNAARSWRRRLRDYERALARLDRARDRSIHARYHLHRALDRATELEVFGGGFTATTMRSLAEDVKKQEVPSVWGFLVEARRLLELFGLKGKTRP